MKNQYLDLEVTTRYPLTCNPLELSILFTDDFNIVDKITRHIKFEKKWKSLSHDEYEGLEFNKICNSDDLEEHNSKAYPLRIVLDELIKKTQEHSKKKLALSGWNNGIFDITALSRMMISQNINFYDHFDYHCRDISSMFTPFYDLHYKNKISRLSLEPVHKYLIGTISDTDFHKAEYDCIATMDIDKWIYDKIKQNK